MHFVVHIEFIALQIDLCKERIFCKGVIGKKILSSGNQLVHGAPLLMIATQQEKDLRLNGITFAVSVEIGEKGILLENFQKDFGVKCRLKKAGEGRLARSEERRVGKECRSRWSP